MKTVKRVLLIAVIAAAAAGTVRFGLQQKKSLKTEDFLSVQETAIQNQKGEEILLEGFNLGGWLLQEYWMCPVQGTADIEQWTNLETLQVLEERFGAEQTQKLMEHYQENWITEADVKEIAGLGMNTIRVPFWYRNFYSDEQGTWINKDPDQNPGFQKLDWIIECARKHGLYVILDMHGCPGGQSTDHCSGSARECHLFEDAQAQDIMEELWKTVAERYKDSPVVAAYDIMNEGQVYSGSDKEQDPRNRIYDRMYQAIRSVDAKHIISMEAIWELSVLPTPQEAGWENVLYQVHIYVPESTEAAADSLAWYREEYQVPVYIGEFSDTGFWEVCRDRKIHHTSWTYKGDRVLNDPWFYLYSENCQTADLQSDSYEEIWDKWGNCLKSSSFQKNSALTEAVRK